MRLLVEDMKLILGRLQNSQSPHQETSCVRLIADFLRQRRARIQAARTETERVLRNPDPEAVIPEA